MEDKEEDKLWELLGQAREPEVSPFFSRNVLRRIRAEEPSSRPWGTWAWSLLKPAAAAIVAAVTVLMVVSIGSFAPQPGSSLPETGQYASAISDSVDYQVIANLDEMVAYEENSLWIDGPDTNF